MDAKRAKRRPTALTVDPKVVGVLRQREVNVHERLQLDDGLAGPAARLNALFDLLLVALRQLLFWRQLRAILADVELSSSVRRLDLHTQGLDGCHITDGHAGTPQELDGVLEDAVIVQPAVLAKVSKHLSKHRPQPRRGYSQQAVEDLNRELRPTAQQPVEPARGGSREDHAHCLCDDGSEKTTLRTLVASCMQPPGSQGLRVGAARERQG